MQSLETGLAKAHEVIALKDGKLEGLRSQLSEAKAEGDRV